MSMVMGLWLGTAGAGFISALILLSLPVNSWSITVASIFGFFLGLSAFQYVKLLEIEELIERRLKTVK